MSQPPARTVLITGCSSGIGRITAQRLAAKGWTVYATARRPDTLRDLVDGGCRALPLDVLDEGSMRDAVSAVQAEHGALDALVNNAGYGQDGAVESVSLEAARRQFETNVFGLVALTNLVLPGMRRQGWGRIVNVSSVAGKLALPGAGWYHASKHAVEALSDALRFEVRGFGIDVVVVQPGLIRTRFGDTSAATVDATAGDDPYAAFNASVVELVRRAYRPPMSLFASGPEAVARVIERAITTSRPRTRYRVTAGARAVLTARKLLPDRAFDSALRVVYRPPRP